VIKPVKKYIEAAVEEISMLQKMNHADNYEYSPTYIESFYFEEHFVIVTSLHGDSLFSVLKYYNKDGFPLPILRIIAKEIITGLNIMHMKAHMTHTDLKVVDDNWR
jgi:serine/threonine-protein kinase SRPK3